MLEPSRTPLGKELGLQELARSWDEDIGPVLEQLRRSKDEMLEQPGVLEPEPAIDASIVTISPSDIAEDNTTSDAMIEGLTALLGDLLRNPTVRLLFDDLAGDIARGLVDEGRVTPGSLTLRHAGEAAIGSGLVARLPAFPEAPVDELLDLRNDLRGPLIRYRAKVGALGANLATRSFDREFIGEIDDLWRTEVEPALLEIEEGFKHHGLIKEIARSVGTEVKYLVGEGIALYVGFSPIAGPQEWIGATAGLAATATHTAIKGTHEHTQNRRELKKHDLFYLYEVERKLHRSQ